MARCEDCPNADHGERLIRLETNHDNMYEIVKEIKNDQKQSKNFQMTTLVGIFIQLGFMLLAFIQTKGA